MQFFQIEYYKRIASLQIGTLSNVTETSTVTAQKNHVSGSLFTSLCGLLGFCFFALNSLKEKMLNVSPYSQTSTKNVFVITSF